VRILACAAAVSTFVPFSAAQETAPPQQKDRAQDTFFSGNVVSVTPDKLTVTRRTLALSSVTKTFLLDSETKIEGKLQVKARVTVKFEKTEDGERAVRVIVR
jgi:hypothetical protein